MRRVPTTTLALAAALALCALFSASAAAAEGSAWWQLLSGSRPSNLGPAPDASETQRLSTTMASSGGDEYLAVAVEVGGEAIGCLGAGELFGLSANSLCTLAAGKPAAEDAAGLQALLESTPPYSEGVEVTGGPPGTQEPLTVTTPGRWVAQPITLSRLENPFAAGQYLGTGSSEVTSEGSGILTLTLTNLGTAAADASEAPLTIHDSLPSGAQAYDVRAIAGTAGEPGPVDCELASTEEAPPAPSRPANQKPKTAGFPPMKRSKSKCWSRWEPAREPKPARSRSPAPTPPRSAPPRRFT